MPTKKKPLTRKEKPVMKPKKKVSRNTKSTRTSKKSNTSLKQIKYLPQLIFALVFAVIGGYFLIRSQAAPVDKNPTAQFVPDQLLVKFKPGVPDHVAQKLQERFALREAKNIPQIGVKVLKVNPKALEAVQKALSHNPAVEFAEKDYVVEATAVTPNDPEWGRQWGHTMIEVNKAWDITKGSPNVTVAVLDSGMASGLADIGSRILPGGYDFINNDADPTDECGHGTDVSGVIAADTNNAKGIAGYDWAAKVLPVRILGGLEANCLGSYSAMISGISYAADKGAKVISLSVAGSSSSSALDSAVSYARSKGSMVVAGAGNSACDCKRYPAAAPGVISVGASDQLNTLYSYSNFGPSWVKVAAPGSNPSTQKQGTYYMFGGTSSATPVVSAVVALMMAAKPTATLAEIENALYSSTDPIAGIHAVQFGRINAFRAVTTLLGSSIPTDSVAPTAAVSSPVSGATLTGAVSVNVTASDAVGVSRVELYRNGALYATDTSSPYSFYWNTVDTPNGSYSFVAKAYDTAGNVGTSSTVSYTVNNGPVADTTAPTARVTTPSNGVTVSGSSVNVSGSGSDNVGVVSTELYVDGLLRASNPGSSVSFAWNTTQETNGSHSIVVKAVDAAGNVGSSSTVTVTVNNASEGTAPVVTIQAPTNGTILTGNSLTVRASATDNVGVTQMQVLVDGKVKYTTGASSLSYNLNIKSLKKGAHIIQVRAYDAAGNVGTLQVGVSK